MTSAGDARHAGLSPALVEAVAGLTAGSTATLVVHPLDIVKTRMQIYSKTDASGATAARPSTASVVRGLLNAPRPLAALYRGLTPNLLGNGTSWAAFFFFKSRMETLITAVAAPPSGLTPAHYFVASGMAGACVQVLTNPLWVLKTRMLSSDSHTAGAYPSMWVGARRVLAEEGLRGFYRGLGVSLIGVSHGAVQFAVYEPLKKFVLKSNGGKTSNESTLIVSSVAKLVAGAVTYPYQVVRSRLQNYNAEARFGRGIAGVSRQLWREDGARGFYRGLVPSVVRVMPATWVTFLVYENVKYYLPRWFS
ncbi:mitochondrial FAD carrier protein flx1 [Sporothrix eucalyptigena]|uniref:Mitochondrial FAD carrier protein flx1 n=1 Tax=Sporothrix eucalyptigena TaxID=1812306 RepID=A0ABP0C5E0_9PEZI